MPFRQKLKTWKAEPVLSTTATSTAEDKASALNDTQIGAIPGVVGIFAVFIALALPFPIAMLTSVDFVDAWLAVAGVGTAVLALTGAALRLVGSVHKDRGFDEWGKWLGFLSTVTALAAAIAVIGSLSSW
ncbi:hypothetical protein [Curtobacterium flaccumfaciens]|uniref:hypothetical protein n=1 Tax=Curtobacterium flaccumfaciens TaxID=2035 RepID=UPI00220C2615|nr:hypothetical protein [Curtobacterium flaccumfaciens]UWD79235.1 hypothetical protein NY058_00215 [Curtobacterium flaccumfaciens]